MSQQVRAARTVQQRYVRALPNTPNTGALIGGLRKADTAVSGGHDTLRD